MQSRLSSLVILWLHNFVVIDPGKSLDEWELVEFYLLKALRRDEFWKESWKVNLSNYPSFFLGGQAGNRGYFYACSLNTGVAYFALKPWVIEN